MRNSILLLTIVIISACNSSEGPTRRSNAVLDQDSFDICVDTVPENEIKNDFDQPDSIQQQVSQSFGEFKAVYSLPTDPYDLGLYQKMELFIGNDLVHSFSSDLIEFQLIGDSLFEYFVGQDSAVFIQFKSNERPEPPSYYIFRLKDNQVDSIGEVSTLDKKIFSDLDGDGRLEIGGYTQYCEPAYRKELMDSTRFCSGSFRVYEIGENLKQDTLAETIYWRDEGHELFHSELDNALSIVLLNFEKAILNHDRKSIMMLLDSGYVAEQHDGMLEGRTEQFLDELFGGNSIDDGKYYNQKFKDIIAVNFLQIEEKNDRLWLQYEISTHKNTVKCSWLISVKEVKGKLNYSLIGAVG